MQKWQIDIARKCAELNMEAVISLSGMTIVCPKLPIGQTKKQLLSLIPEDVRDVVNFEEGPKPSTLNHFKTFILSTGVVKNMNAEPDSKKHHIKVSISGNGNPDAEQVEWSNISELFQKDGYFESWDVVFNGDTVLSYNRKVSMELQKNNFREEFITKDDITDLSILLGTESDFDKLIEKL